jgi:hypothetical protein
MSLRNATRLAVLLGVAFVSGAARAAEVDSPAVRDARALSARVDQMLAERWDEDKIQPVDIAGDAEFMRRVYLDLTGRIPRASEARAFLADTSADKRVKLVEKLLDSPGYVNHFTNVWRGLMLPEANNLRFLDFNFSPWVTKQLRDNVPYDKMVQEVLTAELVFQNGRGFAFQQGTPSPIAFYQASEYKPENLAAASARLFLGVKLECAQCHDHPFARHSRKQFWELAAFFAGITSQGQNGFFTASGENINVHEIKMPGTEKVIQARFPDGTEPKWAAGLGGRKALAAWVASGSNPYFARAAVNRTWAHFFGIGIVDPVDEMGEENAPTHPEIIDAMSKAFVAQKFDTKFLVRAIVNSKAYQLSSRDPKAHPDDLRQFRRMSLKAMSPEQIFDSLALATGFREQPNQNRGFAVFGQGGTRGDFLQKFASTGKRTEPQTSILQALTLMNGKFVGDATDSSDLEKTETLGAIADAPFLDTAGRIEALYLSTLSRHPRAEELSKMVRYVESGGPRQSEKAALSDVFWALLNSTEFIVNH